MKFETVLLAAEDRLGLAVGRKLIAAAPPLTIEREYSGAGAGRLRERCSKYQSMAANGLPVMLLTDLDQARCPSGLIGDWLGHAPHPAFLFRVCVREVEAWLMADSAALARFLGVSPARVPRDPESVSDPKRVLLELARRSRRARRAAVLPRGSASIGPGYNDFFSGFVDDHWDAAAAENRSPSLMRARRRIDTLAAEAAAMLKERGP